MRLQEILDRLVADTPGAVAAILADWEGEAVVYATADGEGVYEIKFIGAHHGLLLNRARSVTRRLGLGEAREVLYRLDGFNILTVPVNSEYYLVLTLSPRAHPFLARGQVREAVRQIGADIS